MVVVDGGGWDTEAILDVKKNNLFGNISETTRQVFLIVSAPHRRVLKTSLGMFRIGKIGFFFYVKNFEQFFLSAISCQKKRRFRKYLRNYSTTFPDCFCAQQKSFKDIFRNVPNWKHRKFVYVKNFEQFFLSAISRFFEVCSRGDLVNFLEVCSSVMEEISLFLDSS